MQNGRGNARLFLRSGLFTASTCYSEQIQLEFYRVVTIHRIVLNIAKFTILMPYCAVSISQ